MMDYSDRPDDTGSEPAKTAAPSFAASAAPVPALPAFDAAKYRDLVTQFELTEDQERALLETLWSIMAGFVELGFTTDVCSAVFEEPEIIAEERFTVVGSLHSTFSEASNNSAEEGPA